MPPPMKRRWTNATVGKGSPGFLSNPSWPSRVRAIAWWASFSFVNSSMSAPAAKPLSLADRIARPLGGIVARCSAIFPSSRSASLEKVLVSEPARSNRSHARWSASTSSFQCLSSIGFLSSYVERLLDVGDGHALAVHDLDPELRLVLLARLRGRLRLGDALLRNPEARDHRAARGFQEAHRAHLVPHQVLRPQDLHHHDHEEGIGHREQRSAEVRADKVAVQELHAQLHRRRTEIRRDLAHANARAAQRRGPNYYAGHPHRAV